MEIIRTTTPTVKQNSSAQTLAAQLLADHRVGAIVARLARQHQRAVPGRKALLANYAIDVISATTRSCGLPPLQHREHFVAALARYRELAAGDNGVSAPRCDHARSPRRRRSSDSPVAIGL